ncbi:MAG: hypothetical protein ACFFB5_07100 [Promethearchaeota archaeon]
MFQNQAETIFIHFNNKMINEMMEETAKWPGKETGGLMFGKIQQKESGLEIRIIKTYIPPEEECIRNNTYFEINPKYARSILDKENLLYLGNWHKHLGYGGPSHGDHMQVEEFFTLNPHKNIVISTIIDSITEDDHELIIEVYKKNENIGEEVESVFQTFRIPDKNISYFTDDYNSIEEVGITKKQISIVKNELVKVYGSRFTIKDILQFSSSTPDEIILSFPFQFILELEGEDKTLDLIILISFPSDFPEGQIYIDISSQDLSRKVTVEKHPANVLYEQELIQPFLQLLKVTLEEKIPQLMKEPLWKVMCKLE